MQTPNTEAVPTRPDALAILLVERGIAEKDARWHQLSGGRTNDVWRIRSNNSDLVCKLFSGAPNALFPNDGRAEYTVMRGLRGSGLAPDPKILIETSAGLCLIYTHVAGDHGPVTPDAVSGRMARVHSSRPPVGLRLVAGVSQALSDQTMTLLQSLPHPDRERLLHVQPEGLVAPGNQAVLLHGDIVSMNIIQALSGLVLIDWQCPTIGDATEYLAIFLSPAMQSLYGTGPLTETEERAILRGYSSGKLTDRYRQLAPYFHWRMAAYCLWKAARDASDYGLAAELELARLEVPRR